MLWTVAYTDSISAAATDTDMPLATDPSVTVLNNHPLFPFPVWVQSWYGMAALMTRVRLSTPRLKPILRPVLSPVDQNATPTETFRIADYWRTPIMLNAVEEVQMLRSSTTAVAERGYIVLTVGDNMRNVPQGDVYLGRGTTSFTPTANVWTSGVLTLDDTLQVGRYSIIGMRMNNAGSVAGRLIFPGAPIPQAYPSIRPGVIVNQGVATEQIWWQRWGALGEYGQFESFALPQAELIGPSGAANPEVFVDLVNIRVGARAA